VNKAQITAVESCKLFKESADEVRLHAIELGHLKTLKKSEILDTLGGIYIIVSGKLGIYHCEDGKNLLLNTLLAGEAFGYASLYSPDDDRYTVIKAITPTEVMFISGEDVEKLILMDGNIALGIIKELTGKIRFLNRKLDSFVSSDLKHRLMKYIRSLPYTNGRAVIPESMSALARRLGVGRASLYRLMSELICEGIIERNGNEIILKEKTTNNIKQ